MYPTHRSPTKWRMRRVAYLLAAAVYLNSPLVHAGAPIKRPWWKDYHTILSHPNTKRGHLWELGVMAERSSWATGWYGPWWIQHQLERRAKHDVLKWVDYYRQQGVKNVFYYDAGEFGEFVGMVRNHELIYDQWDLRFYRGEPGRLLWFGKGGFYRDNSPLNLKDYRDFGLPRWTMPDGSPVESVYDLARRSFAGERDSWDRSRMSVPENIAEQLNLAAFLNAGDTTSGDPAPMSLGRICSYDHSVPFLLRDFEVGVGMMLSRRPAFLHFDNYFDNETLYPYQQAFGPWSLFNFQQFLDQHLTPDQRRLLSIDAPLQFDLKRYVDQKPFSSRHKRWHYSNRKWRDDPIWNLFICSKVRDADQLFRRLYQFCKSAGGERAQQVVVAGNTNPLFPGRSLVSGALDIAHFEHHAARQFGPIVVPTGLPPVGRLGGVTRLGAAISRAGYCWASVYVPQELSGSHHENLHRVMAMDALANRGVLDYNHQYRTGYSPGSDDSAAWANCFIKTFSAEYGNRQPLADVGLVFPGQTMLASVTVFSMDPELCLYDYLGWSQALSELHYQWDVVLDDQLAESRLDAFRLVVLPSVLCLSDKQISALLGYIERGGKVIVSGAAGTRYGPAGYLWHRPADRELLARTTTGPTADPASADTASSLAVVPAWGKTFYTDHEGTRRTAGRDDIDRVVTRFLPKTHRWLTTDAPSTIGLMLYRRAEGGLEVDAVNYDLDLTRDEVSTARQVSITLRPKVHFDRPPIAEWFDPDDRTNQAEAKPRPLTPWRYHRRTVVPRHRTNGTCEITLPDFRIYGRLSITES